VFLHAHNTTHSSQDVENAAKIWSDGAIVMISYKTRGIAMKDLFGQLATSIETAERDVFV
jgi:hypothetical protein